MTIRTLLIAAAAGVLLLPAMASAAPPSNGNTPWTQGASWNGASPGPGVQRMTPFDPSGTPWGATSPRFSRNQPMGAQVGSGNWTGGRFVGQRGTCPRAVSSRSSRGGAGGRGGRGGGW